MPLVRTTLALALTSLGASALMAQQAKGKPEDTEVWTPVPRVVTPGRTNDAPPSDAIVLFDGRNLDQWVSVEGPRAGGLDGLRRRADREQGDGQHRDEAELHELSTPPRVAHSRRRSRARARRAATAASSSPRPAPATRATRSRSSTRTRTRPT